LSKRRKRKKDENHIDESWLLPYSDLMTLLLALFIVLFASSSVDEVKLKQMSAVFSEVFDGGTGVMDNAAPTPVPIRKDSVGTNDENTSYIEDQKSLAEIQGRVDEYIALNELENQFETKMTDEGLLVTIRDSILFSPGMAEINPEYRGIADDIAELLIFDPPRQIVVTGHTDNVPIRNAQFQSNWELSVMRAVNFLKNIVRSEEINPILFSAKGYGEFQPIESNETPEGRSKNRRVEVLIQPLILEDGTAFE
jgi:chemotaxis protein MotB